MKHKVTWHAFLKLFTLSILLSARISDAAPFPEIPASDRIPLKVGFIGPLSGPASAYGTAVRNGIEIALAELGPQALIKFYAEDDGYQIKRSVASFRKLVEIDHVDVVMCLGSSPAHALAPLAEREHLPLLAWASDPTVAQRKKYVVRTYPSGQSEGAKIAATALDRHYSRVGLVFNDDDYSQSVLKGLLANFPADRIVSRQDIGLSEREMRGLVLQLKSKGVDALGLCLGTGQLAEFARAARQVKFEPPFFGCISFENKDEIAAAQGTLTNAWFVTVEAASNFRARYLEKFGNDSVLSGAAIHYEMIHVLEMLAHTGVKRDTLVTELLKHTQFKGVIPGAHFVRTADDQYLDIQLAVKRVTEDGCTLEN